MYRNFHIHEFLSSRQKVDKTEQSIRTAGNINGVLGTRQSIILGQYQVTYAIDGGELWIIKRIAIRNYPMITRQSPCVTLGNIRIKPVVISRQYLIRI